MFFRLRDIGSVNVIHACFTTTFSLILVCYIEGYSSPVEDEILETGIMNINTYSLFATCMYIGTAIGSLIAGPISEWLGLKTSLLISSQLGTLGCMLLVLGHDSASMIVGRFVIGFYTAMCVTCVPVYNAEITSEAMKKFSGGMLGIALRTGMLLSNFLGIWLGFRWLAVIYIAMLVFMNLNLVFLPESPKWLRRKGWNKKADKACEYFHNYPNCETPLISDEIISDSLDDPGNEISDTGNNQSQIQESNVPKSQLRKLKYFISIYFTWPIIRPLLVCSSIQVFKSLTSYDYFLVYTAHTLDNAVNINPRVAAFLYPIFLTIGSCLFLWIIYKVHWKKLLIVTTFVQMITNGLLSLTLYFSIQEFHCINDTQHALLCRILQIAVLPLIAISAFSVGIGCCSVSWWLYGQILHPKYRTISVGIVNCLLYTFAILCQLIGPIIAQYLGTYILFFIFFVISIIALIVQLFY